MSEKVKKNAKQSHGVSIVLIHSILVFVALSLTVSIIFVARAVKDSYETVNTLSDRYIECTHDIHSLDETSDYLTNRSREYVATGHEQSATQYVTEISNYQSREKVIDKIEVYFADTEIDTYLRDVLANSNLLAEREKYAMRLAGDYYGLDKLPKEIKDISLKAEDSGKSNDEKVDAAVTMLFDDGYKALKDKIDRGIVSGLDLLIQTTSERKAAASNQLNGVVTAHEILCLAMLLIILAVGALTYFMLLSPLKRSRDAIEKNRHIELSGASEFRFVANAYNKVFDAHQRQHNALEYEVSHDILTGISNRHEYIATCNRLAKDEILYIIADVDHFKSINDTYGHSKGDQVLSEVARKLREAFLNHDRVFRIGGDEFVIVVSETSKKRQDEVKSVLDEMNNSFKDRHKYQDFPLVSLSFGVVVKKPEMTFEDAYRRADNALYEVKNSGGCAVNFYKE